MKYLSKTVDDERGTIIVIVLLIVSLLTIVGIAAMGSSTTEMRTVRNVILDRQDFYYTESGIYTIARNVDQGTGGFVILDIDTPTLLSEVTEGAAPLTQTGIGATDEEWLAVLSNYTDVAWPINNADQPGEYAYRVYYRGQGELPKGFGAKGSTAYIYSIVSRKQESDGAGNVSGTTTIIDTGHRKIGPKATL
jgi:hypothetical protein